MIKRSTDALGIALLAIMLARPISAQGTRGSVSVGGFETDGSVGMTRAEYEALSRALGALLSAEVGSRTAADVIPIQVTAGGRSGRVDVGGARAAATKAGAKLLVVGSLLDQYGDIHLEVRVIDATSGTAVAVVRSDPKLSKREQLAEAVADVAGKLGTQPGVGGSRAAAVRSGVSVEALVHFGRGLGLEESGDKVKAAEAYRAAVKSAPAFTEAAQALQRVGG